MKPAAEACEYDVSWAFDDQTPGTLTDTILTEIRDADLVIADLSGRNPNVFYELALRHTCAKPTVHMVEGEASKEVPFDVLALNTIEFQTDLAGREEATKKLASAILSAEQKPGLGNPIVNAAQSYRLQLETISSIIKSPEWAPGEEAGE